jgi:hypothetical protein
MRRTALVMFLFSSFQKFLGNPLGMEKGAEA